jgi:adenylosuccinate lyase
MIPRYSRPQMVSIWSDETKYRLWFEIEVYAVEARAQQGLVPSEVAFSLKKALKSLIFDPDRIAAIEARVKHDVIAFLTYIAEQVGPEARYMHYGMTSSDILDTTLNIQLIRASTLIEEGLTKVLSALRTLAFRYKTTVIMGRSHGVHAEPTTFGLKMASAYAEFSRARDRLIFARDDISTCAISGAVGTFAHLGTEVESYVAEKMGLRPEPVSTQIIPRDRHAFFFATLGVIASSVERLAVEIRHLQRTEIREVEEAFSEGQKGSSAMPHKRNPIMMENLSGLARLIRGYVTPALENVVLWHERDISHSSVERVIAPDATLALDFALARLGSTLETLLIHSDRMHHNLESLKGLIHSQQVLLALTEKGISREDAYTIVQRNAMIAWNKGESFLSLLKRDLDCTAVLSPLELDAAFSLEPHMRYVDTVFQRVFGATSDA